jgi:hypothetical protein
MIIQTILNLLLTNRYKMIGFFMYVIVFTLPSKLDSRGSEIMLIFFPSLIKSLYLMYEFHRARRWICSSLLENLYLWSMRCIIIVFSCIKQSTYIIVTEGKPTHFNFTQVFRTLVENTKGIEGAKVENHKFCASVHFRNVDEEVRESVVF